MSTRVGDRPAPAIDRLIRNSEQRGDCWIWTRSKTNGYGGESPGARALRRTHCLNGHDYATHGVIRGGRRVCRQCNIEYLRVYNARRRAERAAYWQAVLTEPERVAS